MPGMADTLERKHLVQAERHIAEAKEHIARQNQVIADLERDGHETDLAISMLHTLEHCLHTFEQHRAVILSRLKMLD